MDELQRIKIELTAVGTMLRSKIFQGVAFRKTGCIHIDKQAPLVSRRYRCTTIELILKVPIAAVGAFKEILQRLNRRISPVPLGYLELDPHRLVATGLFNHQIGKRGTTKMPLMIALLLSGQLALTISRLNRERTFPACLVNQSTIPVDNGLLTVRTIDLQKLIACSIQRLGRKAINMRIAFSVAFPSLEFRLFGPPIQR